MSQGLFSLKKFVTTGVTTNFLVLESSCRKCVMRSVAGMHLMAEEMFWRMWHDILFTCFCVTCGENVQKHCHNKLLARHPL